MPKIDGQTAISGKSLWQVHQKMEAIEAFPLKTRIQL